MILPSKHLPPERALLNIGADLLGRLDEPKTISRLWSEVSSDDRPSLTFAWYVLALDLLFAMGILEVNQGRVGRRAAE